MPRPTQSKRQQQTQADFAGQQVKMPDRTKCAICKKFKPLHAFSDKKLETLQQFLCEHPAMGQKHINLGCVPCFECDQIVQEIMCIACSQYKGLDEFNKTQRNDPDNAECNDCKAHNDRTVNLTRDPNYDPTKFEPKPSRNSKKNRWPKSIPASKSYMAEPPVEARDYMAIVPEGATFSYGSDDDDVW